MIRHLRTLILPMLACAALGACATDSKDAPLALAPTPTEQYPMKVDQHPDEVRLAPHAEGLSTAQLEALDQLYQRWKDTGGGMVSVRVPLTGADPDAAYQTGQNSRAYLLSLGVPLERIQRVGYDPQDPGVAPVVVGFAAYEAVIPQCGLDFGNLASTGSNKPGKNFGCAVTSNMAAQIANPGDIAGARAETPADANRRMTVLDKYRKGETTSTAADAQASASTQAAASGGGS